jgi:hypothetical protein
MLVDGEIDEKVLFCFVLCKSEINLQVFINWLYMLVVK